MTRPRIHYAWYVAAATFVVLLCAAAVRATPSVIIVPLQNEFGWSRIICLVATAVVLRIGRGAARPAVPALATQG